MVIFFRLLKDRLFLFITTLAAAEHNTNAWNKTFDDKESAF